MKVATKYQHIRQICKTYLDYVSKNGYINYSDLYNSCLKQLKVIDPEINGINSNPNSKMIVLLTKEDKTLLILSYEDTE